MVKIKGTCGQLRIHDEEAGEEEEPMNDYSRGTQRQRRWQCTSYMGAVIQSVDSLVSRGLSVTSPATGQTIPTPQTVVKPPHRLYGARTAT